MKGINTAGVDLPENLTVAQDHLLVRGPGHRNFLGHGL